MLQFSESPIQGIPGTGPAAVGLMFNGALAGLLDARPDCTDFLSIIPERFWQDFGRAHSPRFQADNVEHNLALVEALRASTAEHA